MPYEQCRAMNPLGCRCTVQATRGSRFCRFHDREGGPSPLLIWREPKTEVAAAVPTQETGESTRSGGGAEGLEWLQGLLQQAMTGVMAGEATPLQKANAIARLGNLYLKAYQTTELKQANRELRRQIEELEERLAAAETRLSASEAAPAAEDDPPFTWSPAPSPMRRRSVARCRYPALRRPRARNSRLGTTRGRALSYGGAGSAAYGLLPWTWWRWGAWRRLGCGAWWATARRRRLR
jgi:hypothetical protein